MENIKDLSFARAGKTAEYNKKLVQMILDLSKSVQIVCLTDEKATAFVHVLKSTVPSLRPYFIRDGNIYFMKESNLLNNGFSLNIPVDSMDSVKDSGYDLPVSGVLHGHLGYFDAIEQKPLNFVGYHSGQFIYTKPNKQD
jgi:hypothetical protein